MDVCEICRQELDPADPEVIYALKLVRAWTMGGQKADEGLGAYFHERCFSAATDYEQRPKPAQAG